VRLSDTLDADPDQLVTFCRKNRLEGLVAKRRESLYEQGKRSGAWQKFKTLQTGTFLVGGFLPSSDGFSALAVGFWRGGEFQYAAKLECYWSKEQKLALCERFLGSIVAEPPFAQVPRRVAGDTWSAGITQEELAEFAWVEPALEVSVKFLEWTRAGVLRQASLSWQ